ncbi:3297_t:CDS:2, partial [Funneliformis caledonium]
NERMHNSMNQIIPLANQLNSLNNKLVSQITCEQKSHADLNAKQLKEIESLKSTVKSLKSIISSMQKALSLKDSDIISLKTKINELEAELKQAMQKVLLKDSDTIQLCSNPSLEIKAKELENELEKVTQNSLFKDGLIFCLRFRIPLKSHPSSNDSKTGGDKEEE